MLFNSTIFLYAFLPVTYAVYWRLHDKNHRYAWLTLASYIFYGYWNYKFCFLMAFSTGVSYLAGRQMSETSDPARRRLLLVIPIAIDLGLLGFFKYANFILGNVQQAASWLRVPWHPTSLDILLPIGISFYTFHTISYIVDSYRRTIAPTRNFLEFACYVSLFSQLVAGPIVRFRQIESDLEHLDQKDPRETAGVGWSFFTLGMIKKVLIADTLAAIIDPALHSYARLSSAGAWMCMLGYAYQLYFDFSGYSDMAVGLGYLFGIRLPQNFNSPYKATSPADFWHRWHISLSTCLRDYLYIPLGGSRVNTGKVMRNILLTMTIGGLWHGAQWTFVIWGAYHGLLLLLYRALESFWIRWPVLIQQGLTFLLVLIGWTVFRSTSLSMAAGLLRKMFDWHTGPLLSGYAMLVILLAVAADLAHRGLNTFEMNHEWTWGTTTALTLLFTICLISLYGGRASPFLYFQF
jgi:alginate O-acetyltransferase complex protein AlgI